MRVSPPRIDGTASGAPKPAIGAAGADAYRQTGFVLGGEIDLLLRGFEIESAAAQASAGAKFRKQATAATLMAWSRSWLSRLEALRALQTGNYAAAVPLVRAAADYIAAEIALLESGAAEWTEWLDEGGLALATGVHGTEYRLHAFRSAETLAAHAELGRVYREASDLAMPHFGATLLVAGYESGPDRVVATFGDRDFHLGLAELVAGWLFVLGSEQVNAIAAHPAHLGQAEGTAGRGWVEEAAAVVARADRCRIEPIEREGERRLLVQQWRKRAGDAARRILL